MIISDGFMKPAFPLWVVKMTPFPLWGGIAQAEQALGRQYWALTESPEGTVPANAPGTERIIPPFPVCTLYITLNLTLLLFCLSKKLTVVKKKIVDQCFKYIFNPQSSLC